MLYSKTTEGFYDISINGNNIPSDAVEISQEHYQLLMQGQSQGKQIKPDENGMPILVTRELTQEQTLKRYESAIQAHMDTMARSSGYDDIKTAVTYADEAAVAKFQNDGKAFRRWRSLVWEYTYQQLDLVTSGERAKPTVEEFLLELPALDHLV